MSKTFTFPSELPQDAKTPLKPIGEIDEATGRVKYRIWLDAWLMPGEGDAILAAGRGANFETALVQTVSQTFGQKVTD